MTRETERTTQQHDDLVSRLDAADRLPEARALRALSYSLLGAEPGTSVVDVGCGAGRAVAELAEQNVRAIGIDTSERMIATARSRWPGADFRIAGAYELPLPDASVDGYRADKVFHELAEPERALAEARRVLALGGKVVLVGQDWDAFVIDSDDPGLTRAIVHARAGLIVNPRAARQYRNLLLDAGFTDVTVEVHTHVFTGHPASPLITGLADGACSAGRVTREQADRWVAEQRARAEADRLLLAVPIFLAAASTPS